MIWLLACAPSSPWTTERALAPALARLDSDGDGRVVAAEWARVDDGGATFAEADADGDGAVDVGELAAVNAGADPLAWFEERGGIVGPRKRTDKKRMPIDTRRDRPTPDQLVLRVLVEDIRAKDPSVPLPDPARVDAVGRAGDLRGEEARALLAELEAASEQAGLGFPEPLRAR
ncbi:MAG: hypothetical protein ACOZNI_22955 [Myxococcota bacterium]